MPKVDFYILPDADANARLQFACQLIEKMYKEKKTVYIHAEDRIMAHQLDELLWTFRPESFIPHHLYGDGPEPAPPVQIGFDAVPEKNRNILINLHSEIPAFYTQFARVVELIMNNETAQEAGRERYRIYRSNRCEMSTHKLEVQVEE